MTFRAFKHNTCKFWMGCFPAKHLVSATASMNAFLHFLHRHVNFRRDGKYFPPQCTTTKVFPFIFLCLCVYVFVCGYEFGFPLSLNLTEIPSILYLSTQSELIYIDNRAKCTVWKPTEEIENIMFFFLKGKCISTWLGVYFKSWQQVDLLGQICPNKFINGTRKD